MLIKEIQFHEGIVWAFSERNQLPRYSGNLIEKGPKILKAIEGREEEVIFRKKIADKEFVRVGKDKAINMLKNLCK